MGNFVNPKNLKGQDKLNRIKDLMGRMNTLNESNSFSELELIKKGPNNIVYGIVRENHSYFIKTTEKTYGTFLAEDFNYVGGLRNKYDKSERYGSYAEALKHLNLKFDMLNESFGIKKNNNIFESDGVPTANASGVSEMQGGLGFVMGNPEHDHEGQSCWEAHEKNHKSHEEWLSEEEKEDAADVEIGEPGGEQLLDEDDIEEQKRSVIKAPAPTPPPAPAPVEDEVVVDEFGEEGGEEFGAEEEIDVEVEDDDDPTKKIQKLTGKVAQLMRDMDEPDPELDKYVINSVISAIEWDEVPDEDVEDIIAKIEGEEEEDSEGGEEIEVNLDTEETIEEPAEELAEQDKKKDINDKLDDIKKRKDALEKLSPEDQKSQKKIWELRDKIKKLEKEMEEESKKKEKRPTPEIKQNRKEEEGHRDGWDRRGTDYNEGKVITKKQLMESFLKKNTNLALKKVLTEKHSICEECMGGGCPSCGDVAISVSGEEGWAPLSEDPMEENLTEIFSDADRLGGDDVRVSEDIDDTHVDVVGQDVLYRPGQKPVYDRDHDGITNLYDLDNNDDGSIDYGMGNKMYDWPERILGRKGDRDSDGIPNEYDRDVDGDGRSDYIDIDIASIMGDTPAPAEPTIKPGTKPRTTPDTTPSPGPGRRWREIEKPLVNPNPKAGQNRIKASSRRRGMYR